MNISTDNNQFMTYSWYWSVLCYKEDNEMNVRQRFLGFQPSW